MSKMTRDQAEEFAAELRAALAADHEARNFLEGAIWALLWAGRDELTVAKFIDEASSLHGDLRHEYPHVAWIDYHVAVALLKLTGDAGLQAEMESEEYLRYRTNVVAAQSEAVEG